MVTAGDAWSKGTGQWLRACIEASVPILGICYGHQLLAHACGGTVGYRAAGIELGTVGITLEDEAGTDPLFIDMPKHFPAQVVHQQSVIALPPGAALLAHSNADPVQAYRIGASAWGLQFHPEFSSAAMEGYIAELAQSPDYQDLDTSPLHATVTATPDAANLLKRFAALAISLQSEGADEAA